MLQCWRSLVADVIPIVDVQSNDAKFETDNQILSLTDQLNLGLRNVELDTHWVQVSSPPRLSPWPSWALLSSQSRHKLDFDLGSVCNLSGNCSNEVIPIIS